MRVPTGSYLQRKIVLQRIFFFFNTDTAAASFLFSRSKTNHQLSTTTFTRSAPKIPFVTPQLPPKTPSPQTNPPLAQPVPPPNPKQHPLYNNGPCPAPEQQVWRHASFRLTCLCKHAKQELAHKKAASALRRARPRPGRSWSWSGRRWSPRPC